MRYLLLETTQHWNDRVKEKHPGVRFFDVCIYDEESRTYCCEITPSRELVFVHTTWRCDDREVSEEEAEELHELCLEADTQSDPAFYMWVSAVDQLETFPLEHWERDPSEDDEDTNQWARLERCREWAQSNGLGY